MNVVEALETLPQIYEKDSVAALVYTIAKQFCDKKGRLTVKLKMIADHLGLSGPEMKKACGALQEMKLIQKIENVVVIPDNKTFYSSKGKSELKTFAIEGIPNGFEILLNQREMFECYTTLGVQLWKVLAQVANYFHLDYPTLVRLMHSPEFRKSFTGVRRSVEQAAEISGKKVTKRKRKKAPKKSISELTEQLKAEVHLKNGIEIPRNEWKSPQLLRVFVLMYKKRYQEDYKFTTNPFSSLEMKEIKKIVNALEEDPLRVISFLQWCFGKKSYQPNVKNPLSIRFFSADAVIREFMRTGGKEEAPKQDARSSPLPTDFIEWLVEKHPELQDTYRFSKREDLLWLKQAQNSGELPDESLAVVITEAEQRGLL